MYFRGKLLDKKVFLWSLFLLQVFLIGIILLFGSIFSDSQLDGNASSQSYSATGGVRFVNNKNNENSIDNVERYDNDTPRLSVESSGLHQNEFVGVRQCFRDGLMLHKNGTHRQPAETQNRCACQIDYHGLDCGQPEVLWRAFMTAKIPLNLSASSRQMPHKVFYMIRTSGASIETLEIQLMELMQVVDLFILCDDVGASMPKLQKQHSRDKDKQLKHHAKTGFLKKFRYKILLLEDNRSMCTLKSMYKQFRNRLKSGTVRDDDILVVSNTDEILNWRPIKYFKWYDHWPQPTRFRLKYTVYGYYWQHPESTRLGSGACQISVLEDVFKNDPERMMLTRKPGMIVGDLNHVGGWYCQYCYHPENIVKKLLAEGQDIFVHNRIQTIDGAYIESLISNGLFVDGKLGLTRLHRFADKYYAPEYITNSSWKYEGILSNVYATYDDDYA